MKTAVLIAEDSRTQAEKLRSLLGDHGYSVMVASNGEKALEALNSHTVQLVISDIMMPGMNGYELCRAIKAHPKWRDMPVILLTSLTDPMDIIRGLESGADNFLTKPYDSDHLLERIRHVLENRRLRRTKIQMGIGINFLGESFTITADKQQILDLLISTFEDAVLQNKQLRQREEELEHARAELARYAGTLEERIQRVLESVPDIVYSVAADRSSVYYMSPAVHILGFTPEQYAANPWTAWTDRIEPEHRDRVARTYDRVVKGGRQETAEYPVLAADNTVHWLEETLVPVSDASGRVIRLDGVARDITERRRLEEQVRLAQKMEAVGTLAGGVAHDFNNLLTAIRGNAELALLELPEDAPAREDISQVLQVAERAAVVTKQLLVLGRRQVLEPRAIDLNELITRSTSMLRRFIGEDVHLRVVAASEPVTIWADPNNIDQVLMNLSVNARQAMPAGGELVIETGRVVLSEQFRETHPWATPGEYVSLTVTDTGIGMTPDILARIFDPFFTTKAVGEGTGLGLAVTYGIVKQHGGLIHVYSEPGHGTTFRIYLPLYAGGRQQLTDSDPGSPVGGSETILYAEDEDAVRLVTVKQLRLLGYTVIDVTNGRAALEVINTRGDEIDLAMVDVVMPGTGGIEVFHSARERHPNLKFLFMTGYSPNASHLLPLSGIPGPILHKPFGLHQLASKVQEALQVKST